MKRTKLWKISLISVLIYLFFLDRMIDGSFSFISAISVFCAFFPTIVSPLVMEILLNIFRKRQLNEKRARLILFILGFIAIVLTLVTYSIAKTHFGNLKDMLYADHFFFAFTCLTFPFMSLMAKPLFK